MTQITPVVIGSLGLVQNRGKNELQPRQYQHVHDLEYCPSFMILHTPCQMTSV